MNPPAPGGRIGPQPPVPRTGPGGLPRTLTPMSLDPEDTGAADAAHDPDAPLHLPRTWRDNGWTAQVIKNEDDDGWAVSMTRRGEREPALVGPWTMGRDKKNPKPLDINAFNTLVKTASEVLRRHEQQLHAQLHKELRLHTDTAGALRITLDIVPDEFDPHAFLAAFDEGGDELARVKVRPDWRLSQASALAWFEADFARPR